MIYINGLIISSIVFFIPLIICFIFYIFKVKINSIGYVYLYAFTTGLVLILSTLGFLRESYDLLSHYFEEKQNKFDKVISISVIVAGVVIGFLIGGCCKLVLFIKSKRECKNHKFLKNDQTCAFDQEEVVFYKNNKLVGPILLVAHKLIDGLSIGFLLIESGNNFFQINNLGLIIGFILHIIPTTIVLYYIYVEIFKSNLKSFLYSTLSNLVIIPFIFIGILFKNVINDVFWLNPLLLSIAGGSLLFTSILELAPEFIHNNHLCTHKWFYMFLWFSLGIIISICLIATHSHAH